jgi:hypothetical protein
LREGHLVGEDGAFVEGTIAVGILEHEDAVGRILLELLLVPVHADAIADEEAAFVIEAAHDRMRDERGRGGEAERVARGEVMLRQGLLHGPGQDDGSLTALGNFVAFVRREVGGVECLAEESQSEGGQGGAHGSSWGLSLSLPQRLTETRPGIQARGARFIRDPPR